MSDKEIMVRETELEISDVVKQAGKIQMLMSDLMKPDEHYGVIPGTSGKPTLLKAGAEKLCFTFRLIPSYEVDRNDMPDGHREYEVKCTLTNQITGAFMGQGLGNCSTMESKYRYRNANKKCPVCGKEAIIKGKEEYGGGWICFKKKGGCGTKFNDNAKDIVDQKSGKIENPDIADSYNTVLKMAKKRAHVDATITACAASDIFTQDIEDMPSIAKEPTVKEVNGKLTDPGCEEVAAEIVKKVQKHKELFDKEQFDFAINVRKNALAVARKHGKTLKETLDTILNDLCATISGGF